MRNKLSLVLLCSIMLAVAAANHTPPLATGSSTLGDWRDRAGRDGQDAAILAFSDQTDAANVSMTHAGPATPGEKTRMISGAAAGDFNNDGWVDLFVIGGGLASDALFINQGDGTFEDMTVHANLGELHVGSGAAVGDYNNDGWLDLFVTSFGPPDSMAPGHHRLYRNNGDLTFTNVAVTAGVNQSSPEQADGMGAAFGDYDLDGDLDLFVAGWRRAEGVPSLGNRLFRNNGDGTFDDVTAAAGIVDNGIRGFSPCFADMDGDRYPELLLAADFGTSRYFINNGDGTFTDYTRDSGTSLASNAMGSAIGDINNDGLLDWYVTAIFDDSDVGRGDGNKLYENRGRHRFTEKAKAVGVDDGGWGWGTVIVDLNHDGWPDIVETNGWDLPAYEGEMAKVWIQNPDHTFTEVASSVGFDYTLNGLGLLDFDYDNDGDQDFVLTAFNDDLYLYRNDLAGTGTSWLRVRLDTHGVAGLAPDGFGSRVTIRTSNGTYYRYMSGCSHYLTQSELALHFGLGGAQVVDELTVEWADGSVTRLTAVDVNQTITIQPQRHRVYLPLTPK